ncbi:type I toxin-antitoxin system SymE family toxin [Xanthomonas sp. CFBP 8703]|uniref:Type I toxin-antitoxin system SymE family toxin n=1 Tax=Xanthomonas bonasiae TaxID=2810351 RepID=A0ABS3B7W6_9XANT|nr:SymE family type I addiction module toxin [Xanthomonas bonasiae]MBN6104433.1 type I toxin-antitoxin system SymE family toxin [Xanthomonas bonasiae]
MSRRPAADTPTAAAARPSRRRAPRVQWVCVDPPPTPAPTEEELRAGLLEDINEATLRRCRPRVPRQPTHCTVGVDHYPSKQRHTGDRRVPVLRLSGLWLEQLGFAIGSKVQVTVRAGEVVVSVVDANAVDGQRDDP